MGFPDDLNDRILAVKSVEKIGSEAKVEKLRRVSGVERKRVESEVGEERVRVAEEVVGMRESEVGAAADAEAIGERKKKQVVRWEMKARECLFMWSSK